MSDQRALWPSGQPAPDAPRRCGSVETVETVETF